MTPKIGDWVAFVIANRIAYARVEYIRPRSSWESADTAVTTSGEVRVGALLEIRAEGVVVTP